LNEDFEKELKRRRMITFFHRKLFAKQTHKVLDATRMSLRARLIRFT